MHKFQKRFSEIERGIHFLLMIKILKKYLRFLYLHIYLSSTRINIYPECFVHVFVGAHTFGARRYRVSLYE